MKLPFALLGLLVFAKAQEEVQGRSNLRGVDEPRELVQAQSLKNCWKCRLANCLPGKKGKITGDADKCAPLGCSKFDCLKTPLGPGSKEWKEQVDGWRDQMQSWKDELNGMLENMDNWKDMKMEEREQKLQELQEMVDEMKTTIGGWGAMEAKERESNIKELQNKIDQIREMIRKWEEKQKQKIGISPKEIRNQCRKITDIKAKAMCLRCYRCAKDCSVPSASNTRKCKKRCGPIEEICSESLTSSVLLSSPETGAAPPPKAKQQVMDPNPRKKQPPGRPQNAGHDPHRKKSLAPNHASNPPPRESDPVPKHTPAVSPPQESDPIPQDLPAISPPDLPPPDMMP